MLITAGERKAMALLCMALHDLGIPSDSFTGSQAGIITDTDHTKAKIVEVRADRLREALAPGRVPVVGGAQGVSTDHDVTFLGRGGTDTTAVALAQALGADACEIYTDVSGRLQRRPPGGPRGPPDPAGQLRGDVGDVRRRLPEAGHAFGGVRPQPPGPRCTSARPSPGSRAPGSRRRIPDVEQAIISAVVSDNSEAKLTVTGVPDRPGIAARLFRALADRSINVDMIEQNVSMARAPRTSPSPFPTRTWRWPRDVDGRCRRRSGPAR